MSNETLLVTATILSLSLVLVAFRLGRVWVLGLSVSYLLIANIFAAKLTVAFGILTSLAIPLYAAIFLATDAIAEHFGKKYAYQIVYVGLLAQAMVVLFGQILSAATGLEDPTSQEVTQSLSTVFGFIPRVVLGSLVAYVTSQSFDVFLFHLLKDRTKGRHLWLRNICSTVFSQGLDTAIFLMIAFYGKIPNLLEFGLFVWIAKLAIALLDTPFIYLSYRVLRKPLPSHRIEL